jgi:hypothetical protein
LTFRVASVRPPMREIERLIETYLTAEQDRVAAVDAAGGTVHLQDDRIVAAGRAEFDAAPSMRWQRSTRRLRPQ